MGHHKDRANIDFRDSCPAITACEGGNLNKAIEGRAELHSFQGRDDYLLHGGFDTLYAIGYRAETVRAMALIYDEYKDMAVQADKRPAWRESARHYVWVIFITRKLGGTQSTNG